MYQMLMRVWCGSAANSAGVLYPMRFLVAQQTCFDKPYFGLRTKEGHLKE
jgi:hypothetical protein